MIDPTTITAGTEILAALRAFFEKRSKKEPDAVSALTLVNRLHQYIDQLRASNLDLQRRVTQEEAWQTRIAGLSLFETSGGATVFARDGKPPFFCPSCFNQQKLNPLQRRLYMGDCPDSSCKSVYTLDRHEPGPVPVLQRRQPRTNFRF